MANTNFLNQAYYEKIIKIYKLSLSGLSDSSMHQHLGFYSGEPSNKMEEYVDIRYYITESIISLEKLFSNYHILDASNKEMALNLFNYLVKVNDFLPDSDLGIMGFADDAWLIHNVLYRFNTSDITPNMNFSCDWQRIINTNEAIINFLPNDILGKMQDLLIENLNILSLNVRKPLPEFRSPINNFMQGDKDPFKEIRFIY